MDLAKRLLKIANDNQGLLVFIKLPQPIDGFVIVRKIQAFRLTDVTQAELVEHVRTFIISSGLVEDGITLYRRGGFITLARISWFPTQLEAETAARVQAISHIVNVATNVAIQIGDFEPNVPGDGGV
jgi:hypothetical protein